MSSQTSLTAAEVEHLARLARMSLTDEELTRYAGQLDQILHAVDRVGEVLPRAGHALYLRLTAELALGADLARHARDLARDADATNTRPSGHANPQVGAQSQPFVCDVSGRRAHNFGDRSGSRGATVQRWH